MMRTLQYGPSESHVGDLYTLTGATPPVVCLLHGGFWRMPYGRDEMSAVAADLAARGYAVWAGARDFWTGPASPPRRLALPLEPAWRLRSQTGPIPPTRAARSLSRASGDMEAFGVELEQSRRGEDAYGFPNVSVWAANTGGRADGNRKQRGSRTLTFCG